MLIHYKYTYFLLCEYLTKCPRCVTALTHAHVPVEYTYNNSYSLFRRFLGKKMSMLKIKLANINN